MIIVKVINQRVVQVAFAGHNHQQSGHLFSSVLASRNSKRFALPARSLVQSASQNQKVTNANNQQLIPIARNISFRQCQSTDRKRNTTNAKASFSSISGPGSAQFISANLDSYILVDDELEHEQQQQESPMEILNRKAKAIRDKRELAAKGKYYGQSFNEAMATTSERRLVVLLSWLEAKEKHIEKYRQFYLDRGFDVLNVKTSPLDLLLPNVGASKISRDFVRFMIEKQYSNVVLHGFSVGGYMFGRLLLEIDRLDAGERKKLLNSIQGLVFDSLVPFEGTCVGVANSITSNPMGAKCLEQLLKLYLYLGHNIATKHFLEASEKVWGGPLQCPTLFIMSKDDKISDVNIIKRLASVWNSLGLETHQMVVDNSPHVQIFHKHHDQYVDRVEGFLKRINMA